MTTLNQTTVELIAQFAKANKVSKTKLTELITTCIAMIPAKQPGIRGRKVGAVSAAIRKFITEAEAGTNFTSVEIAQMFGTTPVVVNSNLRYLEGIGAIVKNGKVHTGTVGKPMFNWVVVETK